MRSEINVTFHIIFKEYFSPSCQRKTEKNKVVPKYKTYETQSIHVHHDITPHILGTPKCKSNQKKPKPKVRLLLVLSTRDSQHHSLDEDTENKFRNL